jgi:WD40 repeat protein
LEYTDNKLTTLTDPDQNEYDLTAWSADGQYIAIASESSNDVAIWDVYAGRKIQTLKGHTETVTSLAWSFDSKKLASGAYDKSVLIWDAVSGQMLENFKHSDVVFDVAWSPDGNTLATACADSLIYVWDVSSLGGSPIPGKP